MKRGAEAQLTRNDDEARGNGDSDDSNPGQGFQKAAESVLATRKIRPLPSRLGGAGTPKTALGGFTAPSPPNPFLTGNTSSSISSTPPASIPPPSSGLFSKPFDRSHDATPAAPHFSLTPSTSPFSIPSAISTGTSAATNTSKAFASILNTSGSNIFANSVSNSPPATTTSSTSKASNGITESILTKYYTNLRALNVSLLNSVKTSAESDPFSDLTGILESYKSHRSQIQKEYDESSEKEKTRSSASGPSTASPFGGFGTKSMSIASSTPDLKSSPGSVFGSGSKFSSNPFGPPTTTTTESSSSTLPGTTSTNIFGSPTSGSLFGNLSKPSSSSTTTTAAFSTTASSSDTAFGIPKPLNTDKTPTSSETSSVFGSSASSFQPTKLPFSFGSSSTGSNPFGPPATNLFGSHSSSTPAFGSLADSSNSDKKPASSIAFGSPSPVAKNTGVFYGFGGGPQSTSTSTRTSIPAAALERESQETTTEDGTAETGPEGTEPKEPVPGLLTPNPHDEEGAGEENEETVHAVKLKAYRMRKASEQGGSGWGELGMGILRLKKDKDTGARRMLMRNSTNGKININFKIYEGLKPSISKKALTFVGHSDGLSQTYCVRLSSEEQASELKAALDREIEFVKAKES